MRILIISDIHANLFAFQAVLAAAEGKWDRIWCLGDVIGYGPHPNECVELLRQHDHISLSGNHDWAVLGKIDINIFNPEAQKAIEWTHQTTTAQTLQYLDQLPSKLVLEPFTLAHASPRQPVWEYILDPYTAEINFDYFETPYCLVGHTHVPVLFAYRDQFDIAALSPIYDEHVQLSNTRLIINPGSVGQPRDADPRAAYALLDLEKLTWSHHRVVYPVEKTQEAMRQHDLPGRLISRLAQGW
jgi:diadenosine tetraphosphatase ApaH/serine/threonine PP2A family protein phosphatase